MGREVRAWVRLLDSVGQGRLFLLVLVLTLLALLPGTSVGFSADDYLHRVRLDPRFDLPGFDATSFDLFSFATGDPEQRRVLMDVGFFSWWTSVGYTLSFFRPLSSITHVLDYALWPDRPALMMLHNFGWYLATVTMVWLLFRRVLSPKTALLAVWIFALDDAHGPTVGYIANRNALIAAFFGTTCLLTHDLWRRDGVRWAGVAAPFALGASLLAGEAGLATLAYLAGYAATYDSGPLHARLRSALPSIVVVVAWGVARQLLDYGTAGSGMYIDPATSPLAFARAALERVPVLLCAQFALPWSDFWLLYPPELAWTVLAGCVLVLLLVGWTLLPLVRRRPALQWMAVGSLLSTVPLASTFPADRLLLWIGVGASALIAAGVAQLFLPGREVGSRLRTLMLATLGIWHALVEPALFPIRVQSMKTVTRLSSKLDESVGQSPKLQTQTVVVLDAPNDGMVAYLPAVRAGRGEPRPHALRLLSSGHRPKTVTTLDAHTLRMHVPGGFLTGKTETMLRPPDVRFAPGDRVELSDLEITIVTVNATGQPETVDFRFVRPLRDPSLVWRRWQVSAFVPVNPPAQGQSLELPAPDPAALALDLLRADQAGRRGD